MKKPKLVKIIEPDFSEEEPPKGEFSIEFIPEKGFLKKKI